MQISARVWAFGVGAGAAVVFVAMMLIGVGVIRQEADQEIRRVQVDHKLAEAQSVAQRAQEVAQHDRAVVAAVCEAFHRRDVEDAVHAQIVTRNLQRNLKSLNVLQRVNDPEVIRHARVLTQIAYQTNCGRLMEAAIHAEPRR